MTEYSPAKTVEYPRIFPNFQNCARCKKDLKDNKDNSHHLGRKYARIFVLGHYLFLVAHSFPRASLSENCSLLGTDNVRGQISEHIFAPNGDYCLYSKRYYRFTIDYGEFILIHDIMRKPNSIIVLLYIFHIIHPQKQKQSVQPFCF